MTQLDAGPLHFSSDLLKYQSLVSNPARTRCLASAVVSGAGTVIRPDPVGRGDDTLFVSGAAGYMRLDVLRDGRGWLQAVEVDGDGTTRRPFATWLGR